MTTDELLKKIDDEHAARRAVVLETAARHDAEKAQAALLLESEQRRIEREAEKQEAQADLENYVAEWQKKFVEQADAAHRWVEEKTSHLQALRQAGTGQQQIQRRAQQALVEFAREFKQFSAAFDTEAQMRQAAYDLAEQLVAGISWNLPASAAVRAESGIHNGGWATPFGDLRKQAVDRGLKMQPAPPAPATPPPASTVDHADLLDQQVLAQSEGDQAPIPSAPRRRQKR